MFDVFILSLENKNGYGKKFNNQVTLKIECR